MSLDQLFGDVSEDVKAILDGALSGRELTPDDAVRLLGVTGPDLHLLLRVADHARREDVGDDVSYVVCRNINFTNVCYVGCTFCGFSRHADDPDAYDRSTDEILAKARDAVARGATEVCI